MESEGNRTQRDTALVQDVAPSKIPPHTLRRQAARSKQACHALRGVKFHSGLRSQFGWKSVASHDLTIADRGTQ